MLQKGHSAINWTLTIHIRVEPAGVEKGNPLSSPLCLLPDLSHICIYNQTQQINVFNVFNVFKFMWNSSLSQHILGLYIFFKTRFLLFLPQFLFSFFSICTKRYLFSLNRLHQTLLNLINIQQKSYMCRPLQYVTFCRLLQYVTFILQPISSPLGCSWVWSVFAREGSQVW